MLNSAQSTSYQESNSYQSPQKATLLQGIKTKLKRSKEGLRRSLSNLSIPKPNLPYGRMSFTNLFKLDKEARILF